MTPEQKARVITELIQTREAAADNIEYHDREALRYRLQYKNLGDEITKLLTGTYYSSKRVFIEIPRRHGKNTLRKLLTELQASDKLNR